MADWGSVVSLVLSQGKEKGKVVTATHSKECMWVRVVQDEPNILSLPFIVTGVLDGGSNAEPSIGPILHERWSGVCVALEAIDQFLVSAVDEGGR